tara:strand:- start:162 stop:344 length:183 start_codon:yes stop_codon:yes gene_type:complete
MMKKYSEIDIREAVDIVIGDDGMRSKEVIEVLEYMEQKVNRDVQQFLKGQLESQRRNMKR